MRALLIAADGTAAVTEIEPTLDGISTALDGGHIEMVNVGTGWHAYIDEEGKLNELVLNFTATQLAYELGWPRHDVIVGPAVFFGDSGRDDGEEGPVPEAVIAAAISLGILQKGQE